MWIFKNVLHCNFLLSLINWSVHIFLKIVSGLGSQPISIRFFRSYSKKLRSLPESLTQSSWNSYTFQRFGFQLICCLTSLAHYSLEWFLFLITFKIKRTQIKIYFLFSHFNSKSMRSVLFPIGFQFERRNETAQHWPGAEKEHIDRKTFVECICRRFKLHEWME